MVDCYFNVQDGIETEDLEARLQMVEDHLLRNFIFDQGKESRDELLQVKIIFRFYRCAKSSSMAEYVRNIFSTVFGFDCACLCFVG